jgi:hypothetical protein
MAVPTSEFRDPSARDGGKAAAIGHGFRAEPAADNALARIANRRLRSRTSGARGSFSPRTLPKRGR